MKNVLWVSLLVASMVMIAGCHRAEPDATAGTAPSVQARVVRSQQEEVPVSLRSTGTIHARETAVISAQVMGQIRQVLVRVGDSVRAGQTLVVLDNAALRAQLEQAQAGVKVADNSEAAAQTNADLAASTLGRYRQLQSEKSVSPQEMDEVSRRSEAAAANVEALRAQTAAAQAQEKGVRTMMGYSRLVAPFAGVITMRMADPGTMALAGVPLLQIDKAGALQLDASVDESAIGTIHKGTKVPVAIDGESSADSTGTVAEIDPAADSSSHSFLVKIDLPTSRLTRAGTYGAAEFTNGTRDAVLIPRSAVVSRGSLSCVYVVDGKGIALLRTLTLGASHGDLVEVLSGVSAGESLADQPADRDLAGKRVEGQP